jgi:hypothetical protein
MTKTTKTPIEVSAEDIKKIGGTAFGDDDGFTHILCDLSTANIEEILLRSILKCFGEEYCIVACEDWEWDNGIQQIEFVTNLPWESYGKVAVLKI